MDYATDPKDKEFIMKMTSPTDKGKVSKWVESDKQMILERITEGQESKININVLLVILIFRKSTVNG